MPTTAFQPLTEIVSGRARNEAPALLTMTSRRPSSCAVRSTTACTCSSARTSTSMAKERRPRSRTAFATGSRCSSLRLQIATSAPARANSRAMDLPMPVPPPVTIAVLPSSENGERAMAGTIPRPAGPVHRGRRGPSDSRSRGQGDLGLAARHLALDALPDRRDGQRAAVRLGARGELFHQAPRLGEPAAWCLARPADVVVAGGLGFLPRLLHVGHEEDHAVHFRVHVRIPFLWRPEARAAGVHHGVEVVGQRRGLTDVVLDARADFRWRPVARCPCRSAEEQPHQQREGERDHRHRVYSATNALVTALVLMLVVLAGCATAPNAP